MWELGATSLVPLHVESAARRFAKAARAGDEQAIRDLIAQGANIAFDGGKALHALAREGDEAGIRLLCKHGALVDTADKQGFAPLMRAAEHARPGAVAALLACGAQVKAKSSTSVTALHFAVMGKCLSSVEQLCRAGCEVNAMQVVDGCAALHLAAESGDLAIVRKLIEFGANVDQKSEHTNRTPFLWGVLGGHLEIVRYLRSLDCTMGQGTDAYANAMCCAAVMGHVEIIKLLHGWGLQVEVPDPLATNAPMACAIRNGHVKATKLLEDLGASRPPKNALLEQAILGGHVAVVELLLDWGDDPNHVVEADDGKPCTVLYRAIASANAEVVRLLLARGARLDHEAHKWPPICQAAMHGNIATAALLLDECKAEINAIEEDSQSTPLMCAAADGNLDMVKFLIARGANPRLALDEPPRSAATLAALDGHADIVRELNSHGQRPPAEMLSIIMDIANNASNADMVELLIEFGYAPTTEDLKIAIKVEHTESRGAAVIELLMAELLDDRLCLNRESPETFLTALLEFDKDLAADGKGDRRRKGWMADHGVPTAFWSPLIETLNALRTAMPHLCTTPGGATSMQRMGWFGNLLVNLRQPDFASVHSPRRREALASSAHAWHADLVASAELIKRKCLEAMRSMHEDCVIFTLYKHAKTEVLARHLHKETSLLMAPAGLLADCWTCAVNEARSLEEPGGKMDDSIQRKLALILPLLVKELKQLMGRPAFRAATPPGELPAVYDEILIQQLHVLSEYRLALERRLALAGPTNQAPIVDHA